MRKFCFILLPFILIEFYSCGKSQSVPNVNKNDKGLDFSLFYRLNESD